MAGLGTFVVKQRDGVAWLTLDRAERHNAFDDALIVGLTEAVRQIGADSGVRAIVLTGAGPSFSAGADLGWMKRAAGQGREENLRDALALAELMRTLAEVAKPTVARVNGAAIGGGFGLVCCCDVAVASATAAFQLSEVRLGLVPGAISPYVVGAIGTRHARRLMLMAERIDAAEAHRIGLVHEVVAPDGLDAAIERVLAAILAGGPLAHAEVKRLVRAVAGRAVDDPLVALTADSIARARATDEGREGISAFLEKRAPAWRT
ncbi:MAG: enoyl-CoA hydratase/isomerase family protein [Alphaproteobacteria bacterium]